MAEILKGVRILDLSQVMAGPFGTLILADLGAEIIKIENPEGGDLCRNNRQYLHKGESSYFLSLNRNKKSVTLNLRNEKAREAFYDLVRISDVVYDNFRPGTLEKLGIDYETLKKLNPRIISCSVTGFGQDSPYKDRPALDLLIQAMGGVMSFTGEEPGRPPVRMGYPMGDLGGAMYATMAVLGALYHRQVTGNGQRCDIAMLDAQISFMTYRAQNYFLADVVPDPIGSAHATSVPIRAFRTRDGKYVTVEASHQKFFRNLCTVIGMPELASDERFVTLDVRGRNREVLLPILEQKFLEKTRDEWMALLIAGDVPAGPVNTLDEALANPSVIARNMVVNADHLGESIKMVGNPIKMSAMGEHTFRGAPTLGEHNDEVLAQLLGYAPDKISAILNDAR
jgi:crotonobetainyl-CoA:carnitine CoA-transferase CaiB-like acyl-CoA transferase